MYLIIDEYYAITKTEALSGKLRSMAKAGDLSIVNLNTLEGMNVDGSWSPVLPYPEVTPFSHEPIYGSLGLPDGHGVTTKKI